MAEDVEDFDSATSASRDEPFTWQKIARLEGCPGQVDRVPR